MSDKRNVSDRPGDALDDEIDSLFAALDLSRPENATPPRPQALDDLLDWMTGTAAGPQCESRYHATHEYLRCVCEAGHAGPHRFEWP